MIHNHSTRQFNDFHIESVRTTKYKNSFIRKGCVLFNKLSNETKKCKSYNQFKVNLKKEIHLLDD